jgi:glutathione peroxidase
LWFAVKKTKMKRRKLKRLLIVVVSILIAFVIYVGVANRNSRNMTYRQKVMKAVYPALMWVNKITGKKSKQWKTLKE